MKRIAILTTFSSFSEAYSLNRVVMNQIRMLVDNGYKPDLNHWYDYVCAAEQVSFEKGSLLVDTNQQGDYNGFSVNQNIVDAFVSEIRKRLIES